MELLQIKNLRTTFETHVGNVQAVRGIDLTVSEGESVGIVGESGCGKSVSMLSILRLLPDTARIEADAMTFDGTDLTRLTPAARRKISGDQIGMIFQDPMTSLNPLFTVGHQLIEPLRIHQKLSKAQARQVVLEKLRMVDLPDPESRMKQYPHELSGGMRQRIMIAMAIMCNPRLIIADEPTTALDVTIQAQVLDLLRDLKDKINSAIMFITHDLGVIAEMADYVVVMYAGRVIEKGTAEDIFYHPAHPYTIGLMASKPVVGKQVDELYSIPGKVPNPVNMPNYCYFKDRCEMCVEGCSGEYPKEISLSDTHKVSCYRFYDNAQKGGED